MFESCHEVSAIFKESARPPWLPPEISSRAAVTRPATTTSRFKTSILSGLPERHGNVALNVVLYVEATV